RIRRRFFVGGAVSPYLVAPPPTYLLLTSSICRPTIVCEKPAECCANCVGSPPNPFALFFPSMISS
ncbi:MAG TPA: hypothetical protein VHX65_09935, partial [Pirellulales bacterium]|nr:hypothetical protein [Pirellulales bacterium]